MLQYRFKWRHLCAMLAGRAERSKTRIPRLTRSLQFNRDSLAGLLEVETSVQPSMLLVPGIAFTAISVNLSTKYFVISLPCSSHS